jgi:hypothetical protein
MNQVYLNSVILRLNHETIANGHTSKQVAEIS